MTEYSFSTRWDIPAPIDQVWEVLADTSGYPQWWRYVQHVQQLDGGDGTGLGAVQLIRWRTALPYTLTFRTRTTRIERPHLIEIAAGGELEGTGLWPWPNRTGSRPCATTGT